MEDYGNNGMCGVDRKQTQVVDGKQEIYLEWPYVIFAILPGYAKITPGLHRDYTYL